MSDTKEKIAVGTFLSAMHEQGLDGAKVRQAMLELLGLQSAAAVGEPVNSLRWLWRVFNGGWPRGHEESSNEWNEWTIISAEDARRLTEGDDNNVYEFVPYAPVNPLTGLCMTCKEFSDACKCATKAAAVSEPVKPIDLAVNALIAASPLLYRCGHVKESADCNKALLLLSYPQKQTEQSAVSEPMAVSKVQEIYKAKSVDGKQHDTGRVTTGTGSFFADTASFEDAKLIADALNSRMFPVARLHITETDTYPDIEVEVLNGTNLQPSMSPVSVYTAPTAAAALTQLSDEQIINAMGEDGCERIESFYHVGPVQKAAVWSFARAIQSATPAPTSGVESVTQVAAAWAEGYKAGINDERTSEANIGIAGFNAKVEPARKNPYGTPTATLPDRVPVDLKEQARKGCGDCSYQNCDYPSCIKKTTT